MLEIETKLSTSFYLQTNEELVRMASNVTNSRL